MPIQIHEIESITDDLLLQWIDLYETAFPPRERVLVSDHLRLLRNKELGRNKHEHILAAVDDNGDLAGMARYEIVAKCSTAYLWYLAVNAECRNRGMGVAIYKDIAARVQADGAKSIIFEVEIPQEASSQDEAEFAKRRIGFYRRLGAKVLTGIIYIQSVGPHQPSIPMHLMIHSFFEQDAEDAYNLAACMFGDSLTRNGPIGLE